VGRYPFGVELFHLLLHAGLSRRFHKIEHRLFSRISGNWRGRPLETYQTIVSIIANTTTTTGLTARADLDLNIYPTKRKVTNHEKASIPIRRHEFHGNWNYTIGRSVDE
jgi:hypothetical protein